MSQITIKEFSEWGRGECVKLNRTRRLNNRFSHCPKQVAGPRITRPKQNERHGEAYLKTLSKPKHHWATPTPPPPQDQRCLTVWSPVSVTTGTTRGISRLKQRNAQVQPVALRLLWCLCLSLSHQVKLFDMDDIQVVESKPLIPDKELTVCAPRSAKSNSRVRWNPSDRRVTKHRSVKNGLMPEAPFTEQECKSIIMMRLTLTLTLIW